MEKEEDYPTSISILGSIPDLNLESSDEELYDTSDEEMNAGG